jgi:hypothetical protein
MAVVISDNPYEIEHTYGTGKVLTTANTRSQTPQNIYDIGYTIYKNNHIRSDNTIRIASITENIIFLRGMRGMRV